MHHHRRRIRQMTTVISLTLHRSAAEVGRLVGAVQATVGVTVHRRHQVPTVVAVVVGEAGIKSDLKEMAVVLVILVIWLVWLWNFLGPVKYT
jgi:hypothetical protein